MSSNIPEDYCRDMQEVEGHTVETTDRSERLTVRVTGLLLEHIDQILSMLAAAGRATSR